MAKKTRYEFTWVNPKNNYEITDWVAASSKKEAVEKFEEKKKHSLDGVPTNYTVKSTFLIV
jgi:hypothetical protein